MVVQLADRSWMKGAERGAMVAPLSSIMDNPPDHYQHDRQSQAAK